MQDVLEQDRPVSSADAHDALDAEYDFVSSEDIDDKEDEGEGDDQASLALNTPEPKRAMAAADGGLGKNKKGAAKGRKAKAGSKSELGRRFAEESTKLSDGKSTAIAVTLDEKAFGLEEPVAAEPEAGEQELSAYDRDEITDVDPDDVDPLAMLLGASEKPWENEKLSAAEKAAMNRVMRINNPHLQQEIEAAELDDPKGRRRERDQKNARVAGVTAAAAMGILAAKSAAAGNHQQAQQKKDPSLAGVSSGPRREAEVEQIQLRSEAGKPSAATVQLTSQMRSQQARQNAQDVTMPRMDNGLAVALGIGTMIGMPTAAAVLYGSTNGASASQQMENLNMLQRLTMLQSSPVQNDLAWTPGNGPNQQSAFMQALNTIYDALGADTLMNVSLYRQAGWDEKRMEQQENSRDVTTAPLAPEPRAGLTPPAPEPALDREMRPQMNMTMNMSGPAGM